LLKGDADLKRAGNGLPAGECFKWDCPPIEIDWRYESGNRQFNSGVLTEGVTLAEKLGGNGRPQEIGGIKNGYPSVKECNVILKNSLVLKNPDY